ncbi:MAG: 23S rRNA (pseudouridine(1915)-N(3))-methyltransferase RlmH [Crocinitomicaceae bacterium]|nr:23S rRNA (pseudouridine(1915)-N(3))-methyltransferase RlmH [Crocinitomicaceae bacterium]
MKVKLIVVGKTSFDYLKAGETVYENRLIHYTNYERILIPDVKSPKNFSNEELKKKEGEAILAKITNQEYVVLLDEKGKNFNSVSFANWINQKINENVSILTFIIGGAYGFSRKLYERANQKISLSDMTFSHQLVRVIFLEQLYRAHTIIKGEPYHHE